MKKNTPNPSKSILAITVGFLIIFLIFKFIWALYTSLIIGSIGLLSEKISAFIEFIWLKISQILGIFLPNIILSLVYFLVLVPISFLRKIFNKSSLEILNKKEDSNFLNSSRLFNKKSFENPW